jgi:hypothetical protein
MAILLAPLRNFISNKFDFYKKSTYFSLFRKLHRLALILLRFVVFCLAKPIYLWLKYFPYSYRTTGLNFILYCIFLLCDILTDILHDIFLFIYNILYGDKHLVASSVKGANIVLYAGNKRKASEQIGGESSKLRSSVNAGNLSQDDESTHELKDQLKEVKRELVANTTHLTQLHNDLKTVNRGIEKDNFLPEDKKFLNDKLSDIVVKYPYHFDEESGNTNRQGLEEVQQYLRDEIIAHREVRNSLISDKQALESNLKQLETETNTTSSSEKPKSSWSDNNDGKGGSSSASGFSGGTSSGDNNASSAGDNSGGSSHSVKQVVLIGLLGFFSNILDNINEIFFF